MNRTLLLAVAAGLLSAGSAGATTVEHLSIGELTARSDRIFIGRVIARRSRLARVPAVLTETTFAVDEMIKGRKGVRRVALVQPGGEAGEGEGRLHQRVYGSPELEVGERVLLFIRRAPDGRPVITGMAQGKYRLVDDPKSGRVMAVRELGDLHLVRARRAPDRVLLGAPASEDRLPLDQLVSLIRGERPRPTPVRLLRSAPRTPQISIVPGEVRP